MNIPSTQSGHWTDDELLATIYGIGPSANHLDGCPECRSRLASMQVSRQSIDGNAPVSSGVDAAFLAAQRRAIYARIQQPVRWWHLVSVQRWTAGVATTCVLFGSLVVYQHSREEQKRRDAISDAQLAQEVTLMAQDQDAGSSSMAPLKGLFE